MRCASAASGSANSRRRACSTPAQISDPTQLLPQAIVQFPRETPALAFARGEHLALELFAARDIPNKPPDVNDPPPCQARWRPPAPPFSRPPAHGASWDGSATSHAGDASHQVRHHRAIRMKPRPRMPQALLPSTLQNFQQARFTCSTRPARVVHSTPNRCFVEEFLEFAHPGLECHTTWGPRRAHPRSRPVVPRLPAAAVFRHRHARMASTTYHDRRGAGFDPLGCSHWAYGPRRCRGPGQDLLEPRVLFQENSSTFIEMICSSTSAKPLRSFNCLTICSGFTW